MSGLLEKLVKERDLHLSTETGEVPSEREEGGIELERPARQLFLLGMKLDKLTWSILISLLI